MDIIQRQQQWTRRYGPVLDRLRDDFEKLLGPLVWFDRADTEVVEDAHGEQVLRVGPVSADGTSVHAYEISQLDSLVNDAVQAAEFGNPPEQDLINGYVRFRVRDRKLKGVLYCLIRGRIDMYVDTVLEEIP